MKFFERNHGNMGLWEEWTKVVSSVLKHGPGSFWLWRD
jgi:hypothetical protein